MKQADMKWTKGPWTINDQFADPNEDCLYIEAPLVSIATIFADSHEDIQQSRANARLIAQAPAMYQALVELLIIVQPGQEGERFVAVDRKAIAEFHQVLAAVGEVNEASDAR